jgi:hypothetical protein
VTASTHGLATVEEDVFEGHLAVKVVVHGETIMMSDREFRDLMLCGADLFPSMLPVREPARLGPSLVPPGPDVFELPTKPCCGLILGEVCDCAREQAEAQDAFGSPLRWGWAT